MAVSAMMRNVSATSRRSGAAARPTTSLSGSDHGHPMIERESARFFLPFTFLGAGRVSRTEARGFSRLATRTVLRTRSLFWQAVPLMHFM